MMTSRDYDEIAGGDDCFAMGRPTSSKGEMWHDFDHDHGNDYHNLAKINDYFHKKSVTWVFDRLLTCSDKEISISAIRVIKELQPLEPQAKTTLLEWFAEQIKKSWNVGDRWRRNCAAAIEVLSNAGFRRVSSLIEITLDVPVQEYHLYIVAAARSHSAIDDSTRSKIAEQIVRMVDEASASRVLPPIWLRRFNIEAFRTLATLSPKVAIGSVARHLVGASEVELTPMLDAVIDSARKVGRDLKGEQFLSDVVAQLWDRYSNHEGELLNRPGVLGDLIELHGRLADSVDTCIHFLEKQRSKDRARTLYLFLHRPLSFLNTNEQIACYTQAFNVLVETGQVSAFKEILVKAIGEENRNEVELHSILVNAIEGLQKFDKIRELSRF